MKPFCEIIVQIILPAIRALVAKELMESGLTQQEAATKLGVSQAAISQYKRELRGSRVKHLQKNKEVMKMIEALATNLANGMDNISVLQEVCLICKAVRNENLICTFHKNCMPSLKKCNMCKNVVC